MMSAIYAVCPEDLRDCIVAYQLEKIKISDSQRLFNVPNRKLRSAIDDLAIINAIRIKSLQYPLIEDEDRKQVYRWASKYARAKIVEQQSYTVYEVKACLRNIIKSTMTNKYAMEEYGLSKTSFYRYLKPILDFLKITSLKQVKNHFKLQYIDESRINKAVSLVKLGKKAQFPNYFLTKKH